MGMHVPVLALEFNIGPLMVVFLYSWRHNPHLLRKDRLRLSRPLLERTQAPWILKGLIPQRKGRLVGLCTELPQPPDTLPMGPCHIGSTSSFTLSNTHRLQVNGNKASLWPRRQKQTQNNKQDAHILSRKTR
ncbi:hypothetical protein FA13DRAFT_1734959 [Coprinellus micaceus]|uniref:Uncharacterized protein n=1 Tax=Coprinellus micaceus TaxID=71717 RepID=A0A4Y7T5Q5_COPMI|nr:hypothetical protein FA13DRAFT_1734959 [Coprinellus micaceus]